MYDFTARLAALNPPTPAEMALFQALSQRQEDSDAFFGALAGSVPLGEFMSPKNMIRLVGVRGFTRLMVGQARPGSGNPAGQDVGQLTTSVSAERLTTRNELGKLTPDSNPPGHCFLSTARESRR